MLLPANRRKRMQQTGLKSEVEPAHLNNQPASLLPLSFLVSAEAALLTAEML